MTTKKFYQLVDIPASQYHDCEGIDFDAIAEDTDSKTISLLEAIQFISLRVGGLIEKGDFDPAEMIALSYVISDLSELAIATNKIATSASYTCGLKDGK